jgi:hypothetical protein
MPPRAGVRMYLYMGKSTTGVGRFKRPDRIQNRVL